MAALALWTGTGNVPRACSAIGRQQRGRRLGRGPLVGVPCSSAAARSLGLLHLPHPPAQALKAVCAAMRPLKSLEARNSALPRRCEKRIQLPTPDWVLFGNKRVPRRQRAQTERIISLGQFLGGPCSQPRQHNAAAHQADTASQQPRRACFRGGAGAANRSIMRVSQICGTVSCAAEVLALMKSQHPASGSPSRSCTNCHKFGVSPSASLQSVLLPQHRRALRPPGDGGPSVERRSGAARRSHCARRQSEP